MARVKTTPLPQAARKAGNTGRLRVFISYSRRDLAFVDRLVLALEAREIDVIIDKRDLPLAVEFKLELEGFVREADAVVCVVSPASMASPWCAWEIEKVGEHAKRLVPVVVEMVPDEQVPEGIRKINYVFFTGEAQDGEGFEKRADELAQALKLDLPWLKEHTRIEALAHHWSQNGRPRALLMRGPGLAAAEAWRARQPAEAPPLTPLHHAYLLASRNDATRAQRVLVGGSVAGTVFALVLSALALWQRHLAVDNARLATTNEVRALAELAQAEAGRGETTRAIASALQGFDKAGPAGVDTAEVETALYRAVWQQRELRRLKLDVPVETAWFDPASGAVQVLTHDRVLAFDGELRPQGSQARPPVAKGATDASAPSPRPVLKPLPAVLSLSPDGLWVLATRPAAQGRAAVERRVPLAKLGFKPSQAWWSVDATADAAVLILATGGLDEGESADRQIAVANARDEVTRLDTTNQHVDVDPSGRLMLLCASWGSVQLVRADDPQMRFTTHTYYKNSACGGIANAVRYSATEDVVAFIPSSNSGDIEQPVLVSGDKGLRLAALGGHTSAVVALDISPDGRRVLTLTEDGTLRLWQLRARADPALVKQAGGMVLSGQYSEPGSGDALTADYTSDAYLALLGPQGSLAKQATGRELLARPGGQLLLVAGGGELMGYAADNLATPRWRKPQASALVGAVHKAGDALFFTADQAGQVRRWSVADGASSVVTSVVTSVGSGTAASKEREAILRLQVAVSAAPGPQRLWVLTSHRLLTVDASTGQTVSTTELSATGKVQQGHVADGHLSYCVDAEQRADPEVPDCVLVPMDGTATTAATARMPCQQPLRLDRALGLAYCPMLTEALPKLVDLAQPARPLNVFPDANTVKATGLRSAARLDVAALPGCRRGFVNLGGGIPDDMYRGEGLLYDFTTAREIVRTKGDPSPDYVGYGEGAGLPVFCDGAGLVGYARGVLGRVVKGKP